VEYGNYWGFISELDENAVKEMLREMRQADWFTVAEWFRPRDKRPSGRPLLSLILKTFTMLQPLYTIAAGLDGGLKKRMARVRLLSMNEIAARETWSMEIVKRFERRQRRHPKDVSLEAVGYDIVSKGEDGEERFIEVKSRLGGFPLELTDGEHSQARRLRKDYYVYVVSGDPHSPQLSLINDPTRSCSLNPIRTTSWRIENWQESTELVATGIKIPVLCASSRSRSRSQH